MTETDRDGSSPTRATTREARLARARLRLMLGPMAGSGRRTAARRARAAATVASDLSGLPDDAVLLAADPDDADRAMRLASAAASGHDVAQEISRAGRAALIEGIGPEAHGFALAMRALARPAAGLRGEALVRRIAADRAACAALWRAGLPQPILRLLPPEVPAAPPDDPALRRCLAAAVRVATR